MNDTIEDHAIYFLLLNKNIILLSERDTDTVAVQHRADQHLRRFLWHDDIALAFP